MNTNLKLKSQTWRGARFFIGAAALIAVWSLQSVTYAQQTQEREKTQQEKGSGSKGSGTKGDDSKMAMSCPMMAGLKGIKLHADAPPLLLARTEELKLTDEQQLELAVIGKEAREKAQAVLTADQKNMLGDSTEAMSMMEVAMMRAKKMDQDDSKMCPKCMKMMQKKMDKMKSEMKEKMDKKMESKRKEEGSGSKDSGT